MSGAYAQARMNHQVSSQPRKALRGPDRPIALRQEYVTDSKTTLVLSPQGDAQSVTAYKAKDEDGRTIFTASGWKYNNGSCREFRDASGLPLFELHRKISLKSAWYITLPGGDREVTLATGAPRLAPAFGNFSISLQNRASETKSEADKELTLIVERHGRVLQSFDVIDGDRKVAEVCESIRHNDKLALKPSSRRGHRPALDVVISPGVDMSLVAVIAVIASDSVYGTESS
ncbi:hypothetical protein Asppvi_003425 [Aspergillus pseudoviridinutans]|uniref:Tubby C-terminal-like domain-containing protein n=1 Tax=Aspergillus pseudoviridinutans TaxID=1517512 RepID=A0A9P3ET23_9EURO|nr:uncharacterized protein Asppvi_003425 [Aspergillus pseudoviridinutans]GIJ84578.1 hypothetical protein Asppvi_003425 [Aspergillus pseudoviridinutans]